MSIHKIKKKKGKWRFSVHLRIEHFDGDFGGGLNGPQVG